ncbi:hypothetical protein CRUP_024262 [Coryphaenoides rupestris]|nr:hypothetical protein CRUP_024262 [Coryphaenoides rupestris]
MRSGSSGDSGDCGVGSQGPRVPTQKSYSSSETLKAFDQHQDQTRLLYGTTRGHKDMVHREHSDYSRQGQNFSLRQLGICEPAARRGLAFCSEMGLPHHGYSVGTAADPDGDRQAVMSPEHAMRLWGRGGLVAKTSGRSSCLSSRSNSALTLTDTEHDNKSDSDNDCWRRRTNHIFSSPCPSPLSPAHACVRKARDTASFPDHSSSSSSSNSSQRREAERRGGHREKSRDDYESRLES